MQKLQSFLKEQHQFPKFRQVNGRASITNLFPKTNRCGIYVLHFDNDEVYAGQATDVTRRFVQHAKTHGDITHIAFKRTARSKLNEIERSVIWNLESQGFPLRNITFTSTPKGDSDFDLILPVEDQRLWLEGQTCESVSDNRAQDNELRKSTRDASEIS